MALLLETAWGDVVVDLDVEGSPHLCRNVLKLAKARQYTQSLVYRITSRGQISSHPIALGCAGCPRGSGYGGASIHAYLEAAEKAETEEPTTDGAVASRLENEAEASTRRFLGSSRGCRLVRRPRRGDVVALELPDTPDTVGSQFGIVLGGASQSSAKDGDDDGGDEELEQGRGDQYQRRRGWPLLGRVAEDSGGVLDRLSSALCDPDGRPWADVRILRALAVDDPFEDPPGMERLLRLRGVELRDHDQEDGSGNGEGGATSDFEDRVVSSPNPDRPPAESVEVRVPVQDLDDGELEGEEIDPDALRRRAEEAARREDRGRAVVLELLGDLPDADVKAPENVLFVCKLNPVTQDEDLELIFSRFDPNVKVEVIRDAETGDSLQYAFAEFTNPQQAAEAYFKMNNALVDDRRIKVDFSQSVAKLWDKYNQRFRGRPPQHPAGGSTPASNGRSGIGRGEPNREQLGHGGGATGRFRQQLRPPRRPEPQDRQPPHWQPPPLGHGAHVAPRDEFGRERSWQRPSSSTLHEAHRPSDGSGWDDDRRRCDRNDGRDNDRRHLDRYDAGRRRHEDDKREEPRDRHSGERRGDSHRRRDKDADIDELRDQRDRDDEGESRRRRREEDDYSDSWKGESGEKRRSHVVGDGDRQRRGTDYEHDDIRRHRRADSEGGEESRKRRSDAGSRRRADSDVDRNGNDRRREADKEELNRRSWDAARPDLGHDNGDAYGRRSAPHGRSNGDESSSDGSRQKHRKRHRRHTSSKRSKHRHGHGDSGDRERRWKHRKRSSSPKRGMEGGSGSSDRDSGSGTPTKRHRRDEHRSKKRHRSDRKRRARSRSSSRGSSASRST